MPELVSPVASNLPRRTLSFALSNTSTHRESNQVQEEPEVEIIPSDALPAYFIIGEIFPGWTLIRPLLLYLEVDPDGGFIVSDATFFVYGSGNSEQKAKTDYVASLVSYAQIVRESSGANSASADLWAFVSLYISEAGFFTY